MIVALNSSNAALFPELHVCPKANGGKDEDSRRKIRRGKAFV